MFCTLRAQAKYLDRPKGLGQCGFLRLDDTRKAAGVPYDQIYHPIFYVLAGLLVAGFIANLLIRPLDTKWFMTEEEVAALQAKLKSRVEALTSTIRSGGFDIRALLAWAAVGIPRA